MRPVSLFEGNDRFRTHFQFNPFLPNTDFNGFLTRAIVRNTNNTTKQDIFQKQVKYKNKSYDSVAYWM
jgi:hypothetical protein